MSDHLLPRRDFVGALGSGVAAVWLSAGAYSDLAAATSGARHRPPAPFKFDPADYRDIDALTAVILPSDGTPGAREAKVMTFIERGLGTFAASQQALFASGLAELNKLVAQMSAPATRFADLPAEEQIAYVTTMDKDRDDFYEAVRASTLTGFLADPSYGGNANKLGWQLIGFEDRFVWQPPFGYYDDASSSR